METKYTKEDLKVINEQLGRKPRNLEGVAKRCEYGYPQILVTYPIFEKEEEVGIFPTTYWLSCPELVERISKLETEGLIKEIQEEIIHLDKLEELLSAHEDYAQQRVNLLEEEDLQRLKNNYPGRWQVVSRSGVGGIIKKQGIKCLHTHYADYLLNKKNPVGKVVGELLSERFNDSHLKGCNIHCEE